MDLLQLREKEIFETLKGIKDFNFAVIGGYAVNCYTLPRFSVDCDIIISDKKEADKICKELENLAYKKEEAGKFDAPYHAEFVRYEKKIKENFKVSMDVLIGYVKGKTIAEQLKLRVINPDALFAMKFSAARAVDIRDVFMLALTVKNTDWIREEVSKRCNFKENFNIIKNKVTSLKFKDDLQGVFGFIDEKLFEKHKKALVGMV